MGNKRFSGYYFYGLSHFENPYMKDVVIAVKR